MIDAKKRAGITPALSSCHTAFIGDYVIEGHVPADVIERLLRDKPQLKGVAVPGMPLGSPGMESPQKESYQIYALGEDGSISVYETR